MLTPGEAGCKLNSRSAAQLAPDEERPSSVNRDLLPTYLTTMQLIISEAHNKAIKAIKHGEHGQSLGDLLSIAAATGWSENKRELSK